MKKQLSIITLLFALLLVSCEEVIEIDLNSSDPVIVAEGMIRNDSSAWLKLSYTTDYFDVEESEKISDAVVSVSDNQGNIEVLNALGEGIYEAPLLTGVIGRTYTMTFALGDQSYSGSSKLMTPTKIRSVSFEKIEMGMRTQGADYYQPTIFIADNPDEENYYRFKFTIDGEEEEGYYLYTDRAAEDGVLEYNPMRVLLEGETELLIEVFSIDEDTYTYYNQLDDLIGDGLGSSTPYNPESNFGEQVMGFFTALSSDNYQVLVGE